MVDDDSRWLSISRLAGIVLALGVLIALVGIVLRSTVDRVDALHIYLDFYVDVAFEMISIAFTVLILDKLYTRREQARDRRALVTRLSESDESLARSALAQLRTRGWLADGTLHGASLHNAKLRRADLSGAALRGVDLTQADLREAIMTEADLTDARLDNCDLSHADLTGASLGNADLRDTRLNGANLRLAAGLALDRLAMAATLVDARMPDGSIYDGRFHLEGDVELAVSMGFNPDDETSMARFYDIPLDRYRRADNNGSDQALTEESSRTPADSTP